MSDYTNLAHWYPRLPADVLTPKTRIVEWSGAGDLLDLVDGKTPVGFDAFVSELRAAAVAVAPHPKSPVFLRTGHGSGKHEWDLCCNVVDSRKIARHVGALVEWSCCVDMFGLPYLTWVVREFLPLRVAFSVSGYANMPVAREFRCFADDGVVTCVHPYWPARAVENAGPSVPGWFAALVDIGALSDGERLMLARLAARVSRALPETAWSIDFAQHVGGKWFLIDMAAASRSFHWDGCMHAARYAKASA